MSGYQINSEFPVHISNPIERLVQQISDLKQQVNDAVTTTGNRLFLNYPLTNDTYFGAQPSDTYIVSQQISQQNTAEQGITVPARSSMDLYYFSTNPTVTVFKSNILESNDAITIKLWTKTSSTELVIRFNMFVYNGFSDQFVSLPNVEEFPVLSSTIPVEQVFSVNLTNVCYQMNHTDQLVIQPILVNNSGWDVQFSAFYGLQTPSCVYTPLVCDDLPPANTWVYANVENPLFASCIQTISDVTVIPFSEIPIFGLNSSNYYFGDSSAYFQDISAQNYYNGTGFGFFFYGSTGTGTNTYYLTIRDKYSPSNYGVYYMGPSAEYSGIFICEVNPLDTNGTFNPYSDFTVDISINWSYTGPLKSFWVGPVLAERPQVAELTERLSKLKNGSQKYVHEHNLVFDHTWASQLKAAKAIIGERMLTVINPMTVALTASSPTGVKLPSAVDLRSGFPGVYDQGNLGSCTSFASVKGACAFLNPSYVGSALFHYYNERYLDSPSQVQNDSGSTIRQSVNTLRVYGNALETNWPYIVSNFTIKPPTGAYTQGALHKITGYSQLQQSLTALKTCLSSGYPFIFGIRVYNSFVSTTVSRTGVVPLPGRRDYVLGGHALCAVGYNDSSQVFIFRNSWGSGWGMSGYGTIPYSYLTSASLAFDFWSITSIA